VVVLVGCTGPRATVAPTGPPAAPSSVPLPVAGGSRDPGDAGPAAPTPVTGRTLRYRELFVGEVSTVAQVTTWTLVLGDDARMQLDREAGEGPHNSLRVGVAGPLGAVRPTTHDRFEGTWSTLADGAIELRVQGGAVATVRCTPMRVAVLAAGALLVVPPHIHAPWRPPGRHVIAAFGCERKGIADAPTWSDEPQPEALPFVDMPGIEYAHDNDDMVVQQGALRKIGED
jgi:hypothetical protein